MTYKLNGTLVADKSGYLHESFSRLSGTITSTEVKILPDVGGYLGQFGNDVAIGSGRIVVGARQEPGNLTPGNQVGAAYIYDLSGTQLAKLVPSDGQAGDKFGYSVAIGSGRIVVGAYLDGDNGSYSGSAYIYDLNGTQLTKFTSSDNAQGDFFGESVAIGSGRIVVGSILDDDQFNAGGAAYIFDLDGNQLAKILPDVGSYVGHFGKSVAVGCGRIVVGAWQFSGNNYGKAYIYDLSGTQLATMTPNDFANQDKFGFSVAVGCGRIVVGSRFDDDNGQQSGSAYIFDLDGIQLAKIKASDGATNDDFGYSVAVGSDRIIVGSRSDADNGTYSGSVYIFDLDGTQLAKITSSDNAQGDFFGESVAIGSGRIVVGAFGNDDLFNSSGSAYIYKIDENYSTYLDSVIKA